MDKKKFVEFMKKIKAAYGSKFQELTSEMLNTWHECLDDLDEKRLSESLRNYIKTNEFPPTIADLRKGYDALTAIERQNELELRRLYDLTVALYPNANREERLHDAYIAVIGDMKLQDKLEVARVILHETAKYVKEQEESDEVDIMPLSEFLRRGDWQ